jgi:hypothetical protein
MTPRILTKRHPKDPAEVWPIAFRFGSRLTAIDRVTITVSLFKGAADPDMADMILGTSQITNADCVQLFRGGLSGNSYLLRCEATQGQETYVAVAVLPVRTAGT